MATFDAIFPPAAERATVVSLLPAGSRLFTNNTTDKVVVAHAASINNLAQRTIMVWAKPIGRGVFDSLSLYTRGTFNYWSLDNFNDQTMSSSIDYNTTDAVATHDSTPTDVPLDLWQHFAMTHNSATDKEIHLFFNGVEVSRATNTPGDATLTSDAATDLIVGSWTFDNTVAFDGYLYDFRIYNSILTPAEIAAIVAGGHTTDPQPTHNKCQLTFAADAGSPEPDASGNSNDGTITGTSFVENSAPLTTSEDVVIGSSASGTLFVVTCDENITIRFGNEDSIDDATATSFPVWANSYAKFQLPTGCDRFRLYASTTDATTVWYWPLGKA